MNKNEWKGWHGFCNLKELCIGEYRKKNRREEEGQWNS